MGKFVIFNFTLLLSFYFGNAIIIPGFIHGKPLRKYLEQKYYSEIAASASSCDTIVTEYKVDAKVDNFDTNNKNTWKQVCFFFYAMISIINEFLESPTK